MMNEARLGVGLQGLSQAELAYQNALAYAKDRLQGRDVTGSKNPDGLADPIIVHPDVRRNLMDQKCFSEGSRAFILWGASIIDKANRTSDINAEGLIGLLTPVIKGFLTDKGFDMTIQAQQIYGGHGYIEEWGMSQFARDARIAMIYEGANGIQALDLVGRKLPQDQGKNMIAFFTILKTYLKENKNKSEELRIEIYERVNALGIGAQGLGGVTTVLDVKLKSFPTHAASLPVGLIPNCAATRHLHFTLDGTGVPKFETPDLDAWPEILLDEANKNARRVDVDNLNEETLASLKIGETLLLNGTIYTCLLYTSPSPRDRTRSRMPSSA